MATASDSSSVTIRIQNSPRSRQSWRFCAERDDPSSNNSPPLLLSGTVDLEQSVTPSSTTSPVSSPSKEASTIVASSNSFTKDGSTASAGVDSRLDNCENGAAVKKPAWNKPSSGATAEVGAVVGAESWPALSESARASPKSSATYLLKSLSHGLIAVSEGMAAGPLASQKEEGTGISTPNSNLSHVGPSRQRSLKQDGGSSNNTNITGDGCLSQASSTQGAVVEAATLNLGKSGGSAGESYRSSAHRDVGQKGGSYGGNGLQPHRSSFRSNNGSQPRGDGSYHHGHGVRRDPHRGFGRGESHATQQRLGSRPFLRGPAPNSPFVPPPPPPVGIRPLLPPLVYTEVPWHVFYVPGPHSGSLRPTPTVPFSPLFVPMSNPHLLSKIVNQIDYYFSNENLVKDTFLRQNMDAEGWVSIKLIAGFKKVMELTDNIQLVLDAIQTSNVVEVQGHRVRRKVDWVKWIMPPVQYLTVTSPQSIQNSSQDMLAAHLDNVTLDEKAAT